MIRATCSYKDSDRIGGKTVYIQAFEFNPKVAASSVSDSTDLVGIEIASLKADVEDRPLKGHRSLMEIHRISLSCDSTNFEMHILNQEDVNIVNTVNDLIIYTECDTHFSDIDLQGLYVRNAEDPIDNMLYLYFNNKDIASAIGDTKLEISFTTII